MHTAHFHPPVIMKTGNRDVRGKKNPASGCVLPACKQRTRRTTARRCDLHELAHGLDTLNAQECTVTAH